MLLTILTACAGGPSGTPASEPVPAIAADSTADSAPPILVVRVVNRDFYDAAVWVLRNDAQVQKLGTVDGLSSATFVVNGASLMGTEIALYAKTMAEGTIYRSGSIGVFPGAGLQWTIGPQHGMEALLPFQAH